MKIKETAAMEKLFKGQKEFRHLELSIHAAVFCYIILFLHSLECTGLTDPGYTNINTADGIPGGKIGNTGLRQSEDLLEHTYTF